MRLADWPRMPYLNDELREWIAAHLATLGVEEIAIYAVDPQRGQDEERRVMVATEVGLIDGWYAPRGGSSARYGFTARLWPWQAVRGVDLRGETYRVWALEHRTRWWLRLARPAFESETDAPELGAALCDFAKVCAVMAEPAGWQAAQEEVPQRREGLRVLPAPTEVPPEAGHDVETTTPVGRPAVPPPMVGVMPPASEPQPIRPEAPVAEPHEEAAAAETEPEPDILFAERGAETVMQDTAAVEDAPAAGDETSPLAATGTEGGEEADDATPHEDGAPGEARQELPHEAPPDTGARSDALSPIEVEESRNGNGSSALGDALARRLGPLAARRETRLREREALQTAARSDDHSPPEPVAEADRTEPTADARLRRITEDLPEGEEAVDLGTFLPGEEPINLNEYDPDPLGLDGPLHR
jgi:hypothetical protein